MHLHLNEMVLSPPFCPQQCSAGCGLGKQRRTVFCVNKLNGKTSSACDTGSKPASSRKCKIKECSKIGWYCVGTISSSFAGESIKRFLTLYS